MSSHRYSEIEYYKILINAALNIFNAGDFHSFYVQYQAILDKIKQMFWCTCEKLYKITHKLFRFKNVINFL